MDLHLLRRRSGASCPTATSRAPARTAATTGARGDQCDNCGTLARPDRADQPALPLRRHDARAPRDGALLPRLCAYNEPLLAWLSTATRTLLAQRPSSFTLGLLERGPA